MPEWANSDGYCLTKRAIALNYCQQVRSTDMVGEGKIDGRFFDLAVLHEQKEVRE